MDFNGIKVCIDNEMLNTFYLLLLAILKYVVETILLFINFIAQK